VDTYRVYDGTDENRIVGTVAPELFAQEGRCWRMVYENAVGQGGHCMEPVTIASEGPGLLTQSSQFHECRLTTHLSNGYLAATE
jgi:hypothetical protein